MWNENINISRVNFVNNSRLSTPLIEPKQRASTYLLALNELSGCCMAIKDSHCIVLLAVVLDNCGRADIKWCFIHHSHPAALLGLSVSHLWTLGRRSPILQIKFRMSDNRTNYSKRFSAKEKKILDDIIEDKWNIGVHPMKNVKRLTDPLNWEWHCGSTLAYMRWHCDSAFAWNVLECILIRTIASHLITSGKTLGENSDLKR